MAECGNNTNNSDHYFGSASAGQSMHSIVKLPNWEITMWVATFCVLKVATVSTFCVLKVATVATFGVLKGATVATFNLFLEIYPIIISHPSPPSLSSIILI